MAAAQDSITELNTTDQEEQSENAILPASHSDILHIGFNQDASCLVLGLRGGFHIYDCLPFVQRFDAGGGGYLHVEMLFCTSLVALVGGGDQPAFSPRRLRLWDSSKRAALCELKFVTAVLAVRLNRKRVIVCLEETLHIFDITCAMKCLHTLSTTPNPSGVLAFSSNEENCYLAFPGGGIGEVVMYDALALKVLNKMISSKSKVVNMAFSQNGALLATASEQGTVIRVFTVPGAQQIHVLRRGSYSSIIRCIAFSQSATRLAVTGSSNTVHIFDISSAGRPHRRISQKSSSISSAGLTAGFRQVAAMLPLSKSAGEYMECNRAIAHARLRSSCSSHSCALVPCRDSITGDTLLVATDQGMLLRYDVPDSGGECRLISADMLLGGGSEEMGAGMYMPQEEG